ncbi:profilin [Nocardia sp. NPDC004711]
MTDPMWQGYADQLTGGGLKQAAIIDFSGNVVGDSNNLPVANTEAARLISDYGNPAFVMANGVMMGGIKYSAVAANAASIYGKSGSGGLVSAKTVSHVLIGIYDSSMSAGNASNVVENLAGFLRQNGV